MKKKLFRGLSCLLSLCLLATLIPLGILAAETSTKATESNLLRLGRTYEKDGAICFDWSHSGVSFNFSGTGAKAVMTATNNNGFVNVYLDGALAPTRVLELTQKNTPVTYTLAENLPAGNHTITLRKRNEAAYGGSATIGLTDVIITDGDLVAAPTMPERRIEVIGDSITAGHGNLAGSTNVGYSHAVSDGTASYATLTAAALNAEIDVIARSGIRFVQAGDNGDSMYPVYDKVVGLGSKCTDPYDFAANEKDVVIINLGTNDNGARDENGVSVTDEFVQSEAKAFLQLVREKNPTAEIVWAYGIMGSARSSAIKAAIAELNDPHISFYALDAINAAKEGYGSGNHPTVLTAINRSFGLAEYIGAKMGWNDIQFHAQLAWQLRLANGYNGEYLSKYDTDSVSALKKTIAAAKELQNPTNDQIKTAVDAIQTAHMNLDLRLEEVAMLHATELVKTGHQITFDYDMDVDVSPYAGRQLYFAYETKIETTQTPSTDKWLSYVRNGYAFTTDGADARTQIASGRNFSSLKDATQDWVDVLLPISESAVSQGVLKHLQMYYFNDTGNMSEEDKEGLSWSNNSGVSIRVKNLKLVVVGTPVYPDVIAYSYHAVKDFGADPTGQTDATAAIQTAIDAAAADNGGIVYLPEGRYKVSGNLNIPGGVSLRGDWENPDMGGLGKGTILMAYAGRGTTTYTPNFDGNTSGTPFIKVNSGAVLRGIGVWYPEQTPDNIQPYPATIEGEGHADVVDVTLYNSYYGYYNNSCSSMLVRGLYGTVLHTGVHGAYAYDIPRVENIYFDTAYWANSGLDNAPSGETLDRVVAYAEENLIAIHAAEQDWGYWYDLHVNHAKYGIFLTATPDNDKSKAVPGNIAAGEVDFKNVQVGVYAENAGYPGFQLTYGSISASEYGFYIPVKPDYTVYTANGINPAYYENASYAISNIAFSGGVHNLYAAKTGNYGITLNDCSFVGSSDLPIKMADGSLVCSNSTFKRLGQPLKLETAASEAILLGNSYAGEWTATDLRITRDDGNTAVPHTPAFSFSYDFNDQPSGSVFYNVKDYGAQSGTLQNPPTMDSTAAFQSTINAVAEAGGGVAYVPGGTYRIDGSLSIPTGVELRGTFESAHYGNSTEHGSQLLVYGTTVSADAKPLITLAESSGVKGLSIFYPDQGYTDSTTVDQSAQIKAYPPTVQANQNTWIQYLSIVGCYTAIDAMTNRCDNIVITDVTGAAMYATLEMGHGTTGGHVQNLHFNYSGWTHQWYYKNKPSTDEATALFNDYTTRVVKGMILGDCTDVQFLSCFNIIVAEQVVLKKDPYTGGSFNGTMWGVAFDAATNGIVAEDGCDAHLNIVASMGVFNQQGGGYNVVTKPGFTGKVGLYNADAWGGGSQLAYVEGGTVELSQYFSWCAYNGYCGEGGTLNVYASTMVDNNSNDNGAIPHIAYSEGASGKIVGVLSCREHLNLNIQPGADVTTTSNGKPVSVSSDVGLVFSGINKTYTPQNATIVTDWVIRDGGNANNGAYLVDRKHSLALELGLTLQKTGTSSGSIGGRITLRSVDNNGMPTVAYWDVATLNLKTGETFLRLRLDEMMDESLNWQNINRLQLELTGMEGYTLTVAGAKVVDTTSLYQQKQELKSIIDNKFDLESGHYTDAQKAQYEALYKQAIAMYADKKATVTDVSSLAGEIRTFEEVLDSIIDKEELRLTVRAERQNPPVLGLYTLQSANAYTAALESAAKLLSDTAANQTTIDNAVTALLAAKANLRVVEQHTVATVKNPRSIQNGDVGNADQFYHNWYDFVQGASDLSNYDPAHLVIRMNLRLTPMAGITVDQNQVLSVTAFRLALRSHANAAEETSLYDAAVMPALHWGDNLVEIPFTALKSQDTGVTDWTAVDNLFLSYSIASLADNEKGSVLSEIRNICIVNTAIEEAMGDLSVYGAGRVELSGDYAYGGINTLTPVTDDENVRFVGWRINNRFVKAITDGDNTLNVVVSKNEIVTAYFIREDESAVVFYEKYNRVLDIQVVTAASELSVPTPPTYDGYQWNGWDVEDWNMLVDLSRGDVTTVTGTYPVNPGAVTYTLTVIGGHRTDGDTTGLVFDTHVTVQADIPDGKTLSHWELDGMNVGGGDTYSFYISGNNRIKAVYVDEGTTVTSPGLTAMVKSSLLTPTGKDRYTISYICQTYLPAGYTLLEYGGMMAPTQAVLSAVKDGLDKDQGLVAGSDYLKVTSSSRVPNRQYMIELLGVKEGRTRYGMAYIVAKDANGNIVTAYSNIYRVTIDNSIDGDGGIGGPDEIPDPFG